MRTTLTCILLAAFARMLTAQQGAITPRIDLRIGSVDGENTALAIVSAVTVGPDGKVYIAQPQQSLIRVFDPSGRFVRVIGGEGDGPGEFRSVARLGWLADTLWVYDRLHRRASFFDPSGKLLSTMPLPTVGPADRSASPSALLQGGRVLATGSLTAQQMARKQPRLVPVMLANRDGSDAKEIATSTISKFTLVTYHKSGAPGGLTSNKYVTLALSDDPLLPASPNGAHVTLVQRPVATSGGKAKYQVTRLAPSGATMWVREFDYTPQRVRPKHLDGLLTRMGKGLVRAGDYPSMDAAKNALRSQLSIPKYYPPVSAALVGTDGTLWLRGVEPEAGPVEWTVLGPNGTPQQTVRIPTDIELLAVQARTAWGLQEDEDGVPYVVRLRF